LSPSSSTTSSWNVVTATAERVRNVPASVHVRPSASVAFAVTAYRVPVRSADRRACPGRRGGAEREGRDDDGGGCLGETGEVCHLGSPSLPGGTCRLWRENP
jgi:hypothetical protein